MLDFLTIFNPKYSHTEDDTYKQLLLYHSFEGSQEYTVNDKLSQIGIIQALWTFAQSFGDSTEVSKNVIELEGKRIFTLVVEEDFYISLTVLEEEEEIPSSYYLTHLTHCYEFFTLHFGTWKSFEDHHRLTDRLNEYFIEFWTNFLMMAHVPIYKGFLNFWPDCYKTADIPSKAPESLAWDAYLNQQILLDDTSYLGIKDLLVYHLPKPSNQKGFKTYGFLRNFTSDLDSLPEISNWVYHMDAVYDRISSHVLAGNVHYEQVPVEDEEAPPVNQDSSTGETILGHSKKMFHNLTLPISFAYDAIQEVGNMTGVSNSMSLLTDYIPGFHSRSSDDLVANKNSNTARSRFLISPLSAPALPDTYKIKKLYLKFAGDTQVYNCLFWYYNEVLVILIFKPDFEKIWEQDYLKDLHGKLSTAISELYKLQLNNNPAPMDRFCYATVNKASRQIKSSFPLMNRTDIEDAASPLELVVNGLDQFLTAGINRKSSIATLSPAHEQELREAATNSSSWGLGLMGGMFKWDATQREPKVFYDTFLDTMSQEKLQELHIDVTKFLSTLERSKRAPDISEQKLIKLNNGVLCFILENADEIIVLVQNWFDRKTPHRGRRHGLHGDSLVQYMDRDVLAWWEERAT